MTNPTRLGKYEIKRVLGKGAMGIVYEGFDPNIQRTVAICPGQKIYSSIKQMKPMPLFILQWMNTKFQILIIQINIFPVMYAVLLMI